jgi:hypothetical protein
LSDKEVAPQEANMISRHRHSNRPAIASNDNGRFADARRDAGAASVIALAAGKGAVTLSYVADGVMIISRGVAA